MLGPLLRNSNTAVSQKYLITVKKAQSHLVTWPPLCTQYDDVVPKGGNPISQDLELAPQADEANKAPVSPAGPAVSKLR